MNGAGGKWMALWPSAKRHSCPHSKSSTRMAGQKHFFLAKKLLPPSGSDLNPLDHSAWAQVKKSVCTRSHTTMGLLKCSMEWLALSPDYVNSMCRSFTGCLEQVIAPNGWNIKQMCSAMSTQPMFQIEVAYLAEQKQDVLFFPCCSKTVISPSRIIVVSNFSEKKWAPYVALTAFQAESSDGIGDPDSARQDAASWTICGWRHVKWYRST